MRGIRSRAPVAGLAERAHGARRPVGLVRTRIAKIPFRVAVAILCLASGVLAHRPPDGCTITGPGRPDSQCLRACGRGPYPQQGRERR